MRPAGFLFKGANMIDIDRKHLVVMMEAGYVYLGMQKFKEAYQVFEGVASLAPDSDIPLVALGGVDFCVGKFGSAIKWYRKALKVDPNSIFAKVYIGEALFFSGEKDEAVATLQQVSNEDPGGGAGDFARALVGAINQGFTPKMLAGFGGLKGAT